MPMVTPPWAEERRDEAVRRGSHKSAHIDRQFVFEEMMDFCRQGYWIVLPYDMVKHWTALRVSPLGAVPQRDRRPRLIVDYSYSNVNQETVLLAPHEAMQFGRALHRVLERIVRADPRYGPVTLSKIDIADGFYRVWLQLADIPKLGVILPTSPGRPFLIAFPLALPMGWVESPPYFTACTETACDLANSALHSRPRVRSSAHRLEAVAATPPPDAVMAQRGGEATTRTRSASKGRGPPLAAVDVYVDDFLLMAQTARQRQAVLRAALHSIDNVFRPLTSDDPPHRKEPASVKKMLKGDAAWATRKRILGWDVDTVQETLHLPPHQLERLYALLDRISPPHKRVSVRVWHQLLGELRSMSPALPGSRGLFSILQHTLRHADEHRVRVTPQVWDMAADFRAIADSLHTRPTRLRELVPTTPTFIGACDACQQGMGGVWFSAHAPPIIWRQLFPRSVQRALVTSEHPAGTLSISDLELAALIAHKDVLASVQPVAERTMWTASDNRAALAWSTKGSATSLAARAHLLRFNAMHQRRHRYVATQHHIPGKANVMADDASRLWHLTDAQLVSHFSSHYPQASPWQMQPLPPDTNSVLIGALCKQRPVDAFPDSVPVPPTALGHCGPFIAPTSKLTPLPCPLTLSQSYKCSLNGCAPEPSHPVVTPLALAQWRKPSALWGRRMPGWGPLTLA